MSNEPDLWGQRWREDKPASVPPSARRTNAGQRRARPSTRTRIEVRLVSKPRDYVPGSGPPLQPISLLPPRDSTAYIIERIFLPSKGVAADGKPLPKRMTYLVGWRDLPAATMLVPAMKILDYVSPLTLENWEMQMEQELEEEQKRLDEEVNQPLVSTAKRKRGRPPLHSAIESAVVAEPETVAMAKSRPKKGVMSLSTPQKTKMQDFEGLSDEEGTPSRQIFQEALESIAGRRLKTGVKERTGSLTAPFSKPSQSKPPILGHISAADEFEDYVERPTRTSRPTTPGWSWTPEEIWGDIPSVAPQASQQSKAASKPKGQMKQTSILSAFSSTGKTKAIADRTVPTKRETKPASSNPSKPRKRLKSENHPQNDSASKEAAADGWDVERIEDLEYYEVDGKGIVRYFKVRWAGDWPPDQKITWEPEENIPPNLVRNFLKTPKKRRVSFPKISVAKPPQAQQKLPWATPGRQYTNPSQDIAKTFGYQQDNDKMNGNSQDEFFLVADNGHKLDSSKPWHANGTASAAL